MQIRTLWEEGPDKGDMPWLVAAVDEYTMEEHNGFPDFYKKEMKEGRRELIIEIKDSDVEKLFKAPRVFGDVK